MLQINEVLLSEELRYRILSIQPHSVVWISLDDDSAFPIQINKKELIDAISACDIERTADPFQDAASQFPEVGSTNQIKRDENYDLIKPLISDDQYFVPKVRSKIINQIIEEKGSTKQTIYRLARRYWQRGQTPNALIPDYKNSGAKGVKRVAQEAK